MKNISLELTDLIDLKPHLAIIQYKLNTIGKHLKKSMNEFELHYGLLQTGIKRNSFELLQNNIPCQKQF